jgi:hypothetical protein
LTPDRLSQIIALFDNAPRDERTIAGMELIEELTVTKEKLLAHLPITGCDKWTRMVQKRDLIALHHYSRVR